MKQLRRAACIALVWGLVYGPAFAQQPIQDSVKQAATTAAGQASAPAPSGQGAGSSRHRAKFWSGALLGAAGGTAIILGMTALKTSDATSGNTPKGAYDNCVALKANPVYRNNDCDVLKGPNTAVVVGGAIAAAGGTALMMLGTSNSSVAVGYGGLSVRHRVTF